MKKLIDIVILLLFFTGVSAQRFGGNPPNTKWKQINTDTARVIFSAGIEKQAADISSIIHRIAQTTQPTIGDQLNKINIVLQNQTMVSNGYVSLGPFRSEFFLTPRQNSFELGSLPWHKTLALHEYRHVQQFNNFRRGASRLIYYLFGQQGQALANSIAVPDWFFEGDAVYQETLLSEQGRGRIPYFFNPYRSLWASEKDYSWMKLRNGSYRDLIPDHYRLGYMMVKYGREKYGDDTWKKISGEAAAFKGLFYPWQHAIKSATGENYKSFRNNALSAYKNNAWNIKDTASAYGRSHKHFVADEEFPQWVNDSIIVFVKSSYKKIPAFYLRNIHSGKESLIKLKDISIDNYFSYRNGKIVYSAHKPDARWGWMDYGVLRILDVVTGKQQTTTIHTKYLSPDIAEDGKLIVAINAEPSGKNILHITDAATGKIVADMPNTNNYLFTYPKFYGKEKIISAVRNNKGEMALMQFDIQTGEQANLTPFSMNIIGFPVVNGDTISFTMTYNEREHLFMYAAGKIYLFQPEWKNQSTGDYHLAILNNKYTWTTYTVAGFHLLEGKGKFIEPGAGFYKKSTETIPVYDNMIDTALEKISSEQLQAVKYAKTSGLFNFHSWRPYISDPEYSYSLIGENILNTFQSELFFTYNRNEKFKETGAAFAYGGLFPILRLGGSYTFDRSISDSSVIYNWNESNISLGANIPLSFTTGTFSQSANFSASINSKQVYYTGIAKSVFTNKQFNYADISVSFTNQQTKALQNIYPRFAQTLSVKHRFIINKYTAYQLGLNGSLYFPGLSDNHSIVVQASYQLRDTIGQYPFSNTFSSSRGYLQFNYPRMWKIGINYHFPIAYPDIGFGNIIYLLRLRGNVFYDYSKIKSLRTSQQFELPATGLEVYFDTKWWNQLPVSFGIRYSRLINNELAGQRPNQWEFVLPLNLLSR